MRKRIVIIISLVLLSVPSFSNNIAYWQQEYFEWSKQFFATADSFSFKKNEPFKISGSKWYEYSYRENLKKQKNRQTKKELSEDQPSFAEFKYFIKCIVVFCPMLLLSLLVYASTKILEHIYTKKYCVE